MNMLKIKRYSFLILFVLISTLSADKIAVATKVKGLVELMKVGKKEFSSLKTGSILEDGFWALKQLKIGTILNLIFLEMILYH